MKNSSLLFLIKTINVTMPSLQPYQLISSVISYTSVYSRVLSAIIITKLVASFVQGIYLEL